MVPFIVKVSLAERAYAAILDRILRGRLTLGEPVSRRMLAAELGMSMIPVTEALQRLQNEGLVESRSRAGTRVRIPTERDVRESYEIREALESQSARMFVERATGVQRRELAARAEHVDILFNRLASGDADMEFHYLVHSDHTRFHTFIAECTGCEQLFCLIAKNQVLVRNWLYDVAARRQALPPTFHRDLSLVLIANDVLAADAMIRRHVQYGLEETLQKITIRTAVDWRLSRSMAAVV